MIELMAHQAEGAEHLARRGATLLKWDMGTGKTFTAIAAWKWSGAATLLILCPAVARGNWAREITRYLGEEKAEEIGIEIVENGKAPCAAHILICSYDLARTPGIFAALEARAWGNLVLDEVQYLKSPTSARSQAVFGSRNARKFTRAGLAGVAFRTWALSGTPCPNHVGELYNWVKFASPELAARPTGSPMNYDSFLFEFCKINQTPFGPKVVGNKQDRVAELWASLDVHAVRKEDVLDLPPIRFEQHEVLGDSSAARVLTMEKDYVDGIDDVLKAITQGASVDHHELATLRRLTEMAKVGDCIDLITPELEDGAMENVVIFATHRDVITALSEHLAKFNPAVIHGGVTGKNRDAAIDRFQTDPDCRVFIGQTVAAGTAITLHANGDCQDVVFLSADWVPANNAQAAARVHRHGQTGSVFCRFLHLANSIDEQITRALMHKARMLNQLYGEEKEHHAA